MCVLDVTYCIISVLIDELYAAGLGRIDYRLLAALLFPPKLTLSRSLAFCLFFLVFSAAPVSVVSKIYASSSESSSQSQPFLGALSRVLLG